MERWGSGLETDMLSDFAYNSYPGYHRMHETFLNLLSRAF